jgi:hypothetical protein
VVQVEMELQLIALGDWQLLLDKFLVVLLTLVAVELELQQEAQFCLTHSLVD